MAALRVPSLRYIAAHPSRAVRGCQNQRRWAQVHDVRFLATVQSPHSFIDKYREKLSEKAQKEGHETIDDLRAAYKDLIKAERTRDASASPTIPQAGDVPVSQPNRGPYPGLQDENWKTPRKQPGQTEEGLDVPQAEDTPISQPNRGPHPSEPGTTPGKTDEAAASKSLSEIIDLEKLRTLPEEEIANVWRLCHASSPQTLCAVIPSPTYREMEHLARKTPQFVLPIPHEGQGAEMHFLQWTFDAASKTSTVLFTQLAEYKQRGEFAQPHTTITHHLDLAEDKGQVLMQGQVVEGRGVQPEQAKWLIMCLQRFYGAWEGGKAELSGQRKERAEERQKLLQWFAAGDERFNVDMLMAEAERMG